MSRISTRDFQVMSKWIEDPKKRMYDLLNWANARGEVKLSAKVMKAVESLEDVIEELESLKHSGLEGE